MKIYVTAKYRGVLVIVNCIIFHNDGTYTIDNVTTVDGTENFSPDSEHISDVKIMFFE